MRWRISAAAAAAMALAGCSDPPDRDAEPDAAPVVEPFAVRAIFEVPREGDPPPSGFYGLPFPNDVRGGDDGRSATTRLPTHRAPLHKLRARPNAIRSHAMRTLFEAYFHGVLRVDVWPRREQASRVRA
jgi:hypothetical protein